jgi:TolB protein
MKRGTILRTNMNPITSQRPAQSLSRTGILKYVFVISAVLLLPCRAGAQKPDWFTTGTGIGVQKMRVAVADFVPASPTSQPLSKEFSEVVRADLDYSGIVDMVSPSMCPTKVPSQPAELNALDWTNAPASAQALAFGNLSAAGNSLAIQAWLFDVQHPSSPAMVAKIYRGEVTDAQVRLFAHQFAEEIILKLSGGVPGISTTQIAFVSSRSGAKEIWVMDYDGANQHKLTSLNDLALTPRWSPDSTRIAFTCWVPGPHGVVSAQICMYSLVINKLVAWPRWPGTNSSPGWSPDGTKVMFTSSVQGGQELYTADSTNGAHLKRITFSGTADNTSPSWNPKTGQQVVFVSDRGGLPQLYTMNADGTNVQKIDLEDKGYVIDPAWSPNGQLIAFSWQRPDGNYDIYIMDIVTHQLVQLTHDAGRNERPSWAPDGRHIVFESTRTGTRQIWTMLADGSEARQLTTQGTNESPSWSAPQQ